MLLRISKRIVSGWNESGITMREYEEAYVYGVQLLLSTLINTSCIALISTVVGCPYAWIPFLVGFIPIRVTAGGYHAKTPLLCSVVFCSSYCIGLLLIESAYDTAQIMICIVNSIVAMLVVYLISPIPASNKPLLSREKKKKRALSLCTTSILLLISVILLHLQVAQSFTIYLTYGEITSAFFLILGKLLAIRGKEQTSKLLKCKC